jgi:hypothetical protein
MEPIISLERTRLCGSTKHCKVIFIFEYGLDTFCTPYADNAVGDHACIAASRGSPEGMGVIHIEVAQLALDNKPRFVVGNDRTCTVEFGDIDCTCLCAPGCKGDLQRKQSE